MSINKYSSNWRCRMNTLPENEVSYAQATKIGRPIHPLVKTEELSEPFTVNAFVDELQRSGIHNVVICPGSRSTPLPLAIAQHPPLRTWIHVDERSPPFSARAMANRLALLVALLYPPR